MQEINQELLISKNQIKNKKLGAKILLIALALIGVCLLVINFIPVTYKVDVNQNNIQSITFYQNGSASSQLWKDTHEAKFNKTIEMFNNTFSKDDLAYSLFSGKLFEKENVDTSKFESSVISRFANSKSDKKYICFSYATEQQIMANGKEFNSTSTSNTKYVKVLIEITNSNSLTQTTIYYVNANGNSAVNVKLNTTGAQLYDYISTFFE